MLEELHLLYVEAGLLGHVILFLAGAFFVLGIMSITNRVSKRLAIAYAVLVLLPLLLGSAGTISAFYTAQTIMEEQQPVTDEWSEMAKEAIWSSTKFAAILSVPLLVLALTTVTLAVKRSRTTESHTSRKQHIERNHAGNQADQGN